MLERFEVQNYKGFKEKLVFDFTSREYSFNRSLIKDNIVNKAIVYGKNGVGKSSLGTALFDIIYHLTDKERFQPIYAMNYRNLDNYNLPVDFRYVFRFDLGEVIYEYQKLDAEFLVSEKLMANGKEVINYNYFDKEQQYVDRQVVGELNIDLLDNKLSIIKYIYRNTPSDTIPAVSSLVSFAENMLWYRSLSDGNVYSGFTNGRSVLTEKLYESGKISDFTRFLKENGVEYDLGFESVNGNHELYAYFNQRNNKTPFITIASTGTQAMFLFYIWKITAFDKVSFLFIDEFDAFLHYEASENLVKLLSTLRGFQTVLTTHNTNLMNNSISRPDCCYIMTNNRITSLSNATPRELREGHNLEKLYKSGEFNER